MTRLEEIAQRRLWREPSDEALLWRSDVEYLLDRLARTEKIIQLAHRLDAEMFERGAEPDWRAMGEHWADLRDALAGYDAEEKT